jgi:cell wall assembly regulator SMI1
MNGSPEMRDLLGRLESLFAKKRPEFLANFYPGVTSGELDRFEKEIGFAVGPQFRELYLWRNGHQRDGLGCFQNYYALMPLALVLEQHQGLNHLLDDDGIAFGQLNWWNKKWIPFLEGPSGDHLCLDLAGAFGGVPGQIVEYVITDAAREIVAPDLASWLNSYCNLLEADQLDEDGCVRESNIFVWTRGIPGYPVSAGSLLVKPPD